MGKLPEGSVFDLEFARLIGPAEREWLHQLTDSRSRSETSIQDRQH